MQLLSLTKAFYTTLFFFLKSQDTFAYKCKRQLQIYIFFLTLHSCESVAVDKWQIICEC